MRREPPGAADRARAGSGRGSADSASGRQEVAHEMFEPGTGKARAHGTRPSSYSVRPVWGEVASKRTRGLLRSFHADLARSTSQRLRRGFANSQLAPHKVAQSLRLSTSVSRRHVDAAFCVAVIDCKVRLNISIHSQIVLRSSLVRQSPLRSTRYETSTLKTVAWARFWLGFEQPTKSQHHVSFGLTSSSCQATRERHPCARLVAQPD